VVTRQNEVALLIGDGRRLRGLNFWIQVRHELDHDIGQRRAIQFNGPLDLLIHSPASSPAAGAKQQKKRKQHSQLAHGHSLKMGTKMSGIRPTRHSTPAQIAWLDQYCVASMTSPPLRVESCCKTFSGVLSTRNFTEPSAKQKFAPLSWNEP